jgi:NADPH:quinone reductase-like Zn-dependent oxidoreductase
VPVAGITASIALNKARVDKTASVFIAGGAGGAGTFTILLARQLGVRNLVTTAGNAKSRDYLIAHSCDLAKIPGSTGSPIAAFCQRRTRTTADNHPRRAIL